MLFIFFLCACEILLIKYIKFCINIWGAFFNPSLPNCQAQVQVQGQVPRQVQKVQGQRTKDLDLGLTLNLVCHSPPTPTQQTFLLEIKSSNHYCMSSNYVPFKMTFRMTFGMTFRMTFRVTFRVTFRMSHRMTFKTWYFRGVFNEDLEGDLERGLERDLERDLEGDSKGDFRGDFKQNMEGDLLSS